MKLSEFFRLRQKKNVVASNILALVVFTYNINYIIFNLFGYDG